jgi:hypothetical protein
MRSLFILSLILFSSVASADQTFQLPAFNSVKTDGVFSTLITAGSAQSVMVKGDNDTIKKLSFQVTDGQLMINGPENKNKTSFNVDELKIIITVPNLRLFKGKGVGEVILKNIDSDRIDISYEGVGNLEAYGKTKWLRLKGQGVGSIDTKKLIAEDADVDFDGVGNVDVYVSNRFNAVVSGVGSVTYYGNPHSINKSADGIGSISPGK